MTLPPWSCTTPAGLAALLAAPGLLPPGCLDRLATPAGASLPSAREYLGLFALTLAVELPLVVPPLRAAGLSARAAVSAGFAANALTHPFICLALRPLAAYAGMSTAAYVLAAEAFALAAETVVYLAALPRGAATLAPALSAGANLASWTLGAAWLAFTLG